jgi:hypothetical protein
MVRMGQEVTYQTDFEKTGFRLVGLAFTGSQFI